MSHVPIPAACRRIFLALAVALLAGACSDAVRENRALLRPWLDEIPRTFAVTLGQQAPSPVLIDRESRLVAGLKGFFAGAVVGAIAPWTGGPAPIGDEAGPVTAAFAAIGAVVGAVYLASSPGESFRPVTEVPRLASLMEPAMAERQFERALQSSVVAAAPHRTPHQLRAVDPGQVAGWSGFPVGIDGMVTLEVDRIGFLEEGGDPPRFAFLARGSAYLTRDWRSSSSFDVPRGLPVARLRYEGTARSAAELAANDGALLGAERRAAMARLAAQAVRALQGAAAAGKSEARAYQLD